MTLCVPLSTYFVFCSRSQLSNDFVRKFLIEFCILRPPVTQISNSLLLFYERDEELGNQLSIGAIM